MTINKAPDAFRTISEAAQELDTAAHVLRFWETRFTQIKPIKRAGGRRFYRSNDMALLFGLKKILHHDGLSINGAQKLLREKGVKFVIALGEGHGISSLSWVLKRTYLALNLRDLWRAHQSRRHHKTK